MRCTLCDPIQAYSDGNLAGKQAGDGARQLAPVCKQRANYLKPKEI